MPLRNDVVKAVIDTLDKSLWPSIATDPDKVFTVEQLLWSAMSHQMDADVWWQALEEKAGRKELNPEELSGFLQTLTSVLISGLQEFRDSLPRIVQDLKAKGPQGRTPESGFWQVVNYVKNSMLITVPVITLQSGDASGDMFGIAASLLLSPLSRVIVLQPEDPSTSKHARSILDFYKQSGLEKRAEPFAYTSTGRDEKRKELARTLVGKSSAPGPIFWVVDVDFGTRYLSVINWSESDARQIIRDTWQVTDEQFVPKVPAIVQWLNGRKVPFEKLKEARVLLLWSRFTGKKGEIHVEHDTSFEGMKQLIQLALNESKIDYVFIVGDKPVVSEKASAEEEQKKKLRFKEMEKLSPGRIFDFTEFWRDDDAKWCSTRMEQFKLYELLHRWSQTKHLGFRSGNMEALALLGYTVRYLEEVKSWGGDRMERWHKTGLGYERIQVKRVPTRTGQYVVELYRDKKKAKAPVRPDWVPALRDSPDEKPEAVQQYKPGFDTGDLKLIQAYLLNEPYTPRPSGFEPAHV
ncbi:MAG: hypothetical protein ACJ8AT_33030 [Hyalangium sp.]|uniref:hypothetical protein n=1 Tax=Hyalangium sp. TaxID=2028555 RepID=UPI00389AF96A